MALELGLLEIKNLTVEFMFGTKRLVAVDGASLSISRKEIIGLVGESGSGKTMTALSILNLIPFPGRITRGDIRLEGVDKNLLSLSTDEIRGVRGRKISVVFQDSLTSLNPCFTVGWQLSEVVKRKGTKVSKRQSDELIEETLGRLRFKNIDQVMKAYPHQLSGGMRQRIAIAMALILGAWTGPG